MEIVIVCFRYMQTLLWWALPAEGESTQRAREPASRKLGVLFANFHKRRLKERRCIIRVIKVQLLKKKWWISYPGWFHWLTFVGSSTALHRAGRCWAGLLLDDGVEPVAQWRQMTADGPLESKAWLGNGEGQEQNIPWRPCCPARRKPWSPRRWRSHHTVTVPSATESLTSKWLVWGYVNFTFFISLKMNFQGHLGVLNQLSIWLLISTQVLILEYGIEPRVGLCAQCRVCLNSLSLSLCLLPTHMHTVSLNN